MQREKKTLFLRVDGVRSRDPINAGGDQPREAWQRDEPQGLHWTPNSQSGAIQCNSRNQEFETREFAAGVASQLCL